MLHSDIQRRMINLLKQLGVAALYALLAKIVLTLFADNGVVSVVWPSSGLALAVLLIGGKRHFWGVFLGAFLANAMTGITLMPAIAIAMGNTFEALIGAWLLTRNGRFDTTLQSLRSYLLLILGGSIGSIHGALNGATTLLISGFIPSETYLTNLTHWWMGDVLGIALITPLILVCWQTKNDWLGAKRVVEAASLLGLTFLAGQIVFLGWLHESLGNIALGYWMFMLTAWVAVRLGTRGTVIVLTMAAVQALLSAYHGVGFFANDIAQTQLANYWFYMVTLSVVGMALATFISERNRSEMELQRFFNLVPDMVCIASTDGCFKKINRAWQTTLGYTEQEILSTPFLELIHPDDRDVTMKEVERQLSGEATIHFSNRYRCRDGSYKWLEWYATPAVDRTQLFASARDITERKHIEDELKLTKERYDFATAVGKVGTWDWNPATGDLIWSDETFRLMGFTPGSVTPSYELYLGLVHPEDRELLQSAVQAALHEKKPFDFDCRIVLGSGKELACNATGQVEFDAKDQPTRMLGTIQDITVRKQMERTLQESEGRLQGIINNASAVIFMKDTAGRYLLVNSLYEKLFHVSNAAIQGKTDHDIFPREMADALVKNDQKIVHSGQSIEIEELVPQDDGIHTYISVKFPLRNAFGEIYAVCGIATDITERKKTETALVESHNLLKTVINAVPVRIFWKDKKLRYLGCNRFFAKDAGEASPQDIIGKNDYQLAWKEQAELYNADDRRVMDSGIPKLSYEEPQTTPDGKAVWLRTSKVPLCNADNETIGVLGVYEDITKKKQAEVALRENEERLQGIMNNAPAVIFIKDTAGRYLFVNILHEQLFHIPNAAIRGKTDYDIFPRDVADLFIESDRKVIHSGLPLEAEERVPQDDGIHTYISVKFPLRNAFGEIYAVCGIATDITERKQAEERHRTLIDAISSAGIMLFLVDDTYRVRYMNRPMIEAFGDAVGKICYKYVGGIESPCSYCRLGAIIGGHSKMVHYQPTTDDGRTLDIIAIPYVDTDGKTCKLEVIQDITERKAAEQQLRDLSAHMLNVREEEKASIAREIHDDLGGTLTALKIGAYWLSRKLPVNQETAPLLERIESMSQLIDNAVVATRRIISGMRPTILDDLGILAAIEWQAVEFYKHTGIECQVNCVEDEDNLDKQRSIALFRILQEALTNVSRHSYASKVEIEFLHSEKEVILMISDNGRGMPGNHVATEKPYGMLGMTERIEQLGGKIIFSSPPDGGFSVTVILPLPADNNKKGEV